MIANPTSMLSSCSFAKSFAVCYIWSKLKNAAGSRPGTWCTNLAAYQIPFQIFCPSQMNVNPKQIMELLTENAGRFSVSPQSLFCVRGLISRSVWHFRYFLGTWLWESWLLLWESEMSVHLLFKHTYYPGGVAMGPHWPVSSGRWARVWNMTLMDFKSNYIA